MAVRPDKPREFERAMRAVRFDFEVYEMLPARLRRALRHAAVNISAASVMMSYQAGVPVEVIERGIKAQR